MMLGSGLVSAVLLVAAIGSVEATYGKPRQQCYPKTQYVTKYQTEYQKVMEAREAKRMGVR